MRPRTEQTRLMIAVLASIAAHALAIVALAGSYGTLLGDDASAITTEDELQEIRLGIERSEAQTVDWIGYDEYRRHIAPPADQSQAQMTLGAARATPPSPPAPEPTAPSDAVEPSPPTSAPARPIEELLLEQLFENLDNPTFLAMLEPAPEQDQEQDQEQKQEPKDAPAKPEAPKSQASPNQPTPPAQEAVTVEELEGDSDKDADAVSKETDKKIKEYILGRPLSAEGLDIRTVRPMWSVRTTLLARPRNPRVRIHFNRKGKVALAVIEQTTGEPDVDRPLLDAIYQWRATGDQLLKLPEDDPDATIAITLTIKLH